MARDMEYLTEPPAAVPSGRVLVHNVQAGGPNRVLGSGGFRAWWAPDAPAPNRVPCDCGWAGLGPHYRRRGSDE
jgi:hypothetical protein